MMKCISILKDYTASSGEGRRKLKGGETRGEWADDESGAGCRAAVITKTGVTGE